MASVSRVPNDKGYGDFCFGRSVEKQDLEKREDSSSVILCAEELNGFQRTGPFPFFKLPVEIRHAILRMLLQPFYKTSPRDNIPHVSLNVGGWNLSRANFIGNADSCFWDLDDKITLLKYTEGKEKAEMSPQEWYKALTAHGREKWRHFHRKIYHPSRKVERGSQYTLHSTSLDEKSELSAYDKLAWIEFVRQMSNVSPQFRQELRAVFWSRVHLNMPVVYLRQESDPILLPLLHDRPGICSGLKHLRLSFMPKLKNFASLVTELSKLVTLERFTLQIDAREGELKALASEMGPLWSALSGIRKLKVQTMFIVSQCHSNVRVDQSQLYAEYGDFKPGKIVPLEILRRYEADFKNEYIPAIWRVLCPKTLWRSRPTRDESYLAGRSGNGERERQLRKVGYKMDVYGPRYERLAG